jgi:hypothetical protein
MTAGSPLRSASCVCVCVCVFYTFYRILFRIMLLLTSYTLHWSVSRSYLSMTPAEYSKGRGSPVRDEGSAAGFTALKHLVLSFWSLLSTKPKPRPDSKSTVCPS